MSSVRQKSTAYAAAWTVDHFGPTLALWQVSLMDTDTQVFQDIVAEFNASPLPQNAQLHLQVQDGVVTISGRMNSFAEHKAVERAAKRVAGIRTLILEIPAAAIPSTVMDSPLDIVGCTAPGKN